MKSQKEKSKERRQYINKRFGENLKLVADDPESLFAEGELDEA